MPDSMHFDTKTIFYTQKITTLQVKNCKKHTENNKKQKTKHLNLQKKIQIDLSAHLHTTTDNIQKNFFKKQLPRFLKTLDKETHRTKLYYRRLKIF